MFVTSAQQSSKHVAFATLISTQPQESNWPKTEKKTWFQHKAHICPQNERMQFV